MIYRVTEVPKGNIPAHELLYRILELGPLSCDRNSQIQVGPLTVYPSLAPPKDSGPAGQTGLCCLDLNQRSSALFCLTLNSSMRLSVEKEVSTTKRPRGRLPCFMA